MCTYLKVLGLHVYLATTKRSYIANANYVEANAQAMVALKKILKNDYLCRIDNGDSAFSVWNMLISLEEQSSNDLERKSSEDDSNQACYMVQENDSSEVNSESELDDCESVSNDNASMSSEDAHMLNDELAMFCEDLLAKYKLLKNKNLKLKKENKFLSSKLDLVLNEKEQVLNEISSLKSHVELIFKKRDFALNEKDSLKVKLDFFSKENETLKKKIVLISKEKDSLKNTLVQKEKIFFPKEKIFVSNVLSTPINKNEICDLKSRIDCLGSTLSQ